MSFITAIGTATPVNRFNQSDIADFMIKAMQLNEVDARKLRVIFKVTSIETRHSVINDYGRKKAFDFFPDENEGKPFPGTKQRIDIYRREALNLSLAAVTDCLTSKNNFDRNSITHLIAVSCTGMYAPGLDIDLVHALKLPSHTQRLCINFMGCYAAFNAMKQADYICNAQPGAKVLIVCTELCSIHFQKENTEDNLLANSLFADGSAAMLIESSPKSGINLKPISFFADLATEGSNDMAWAIGDFGFEMRLSSYVPDIIKGGIHQLIVKLLAQINSQLSDIDFYAIHPGGKKILEVIESELHLTKADNKFAYEVLKNFGNMSSPTVVFVLREVLRQLNQADSGKKILSLAFGPGLTLESSILQVINHTDAN